MHPANADLTNHIKQWARELGFDLVGVAPAEPVANADVFRRWIAKGRHGQMRYLERNLERRLDPRQLVPGARTIICTASNYFAPPPETEAAAANLRTPRYAWSADYHHTIKDRLTKLAARIRTATSPQTILRSFVDTGPLVEKAHAARAGLGWIGKNSLLINQQFGSWLLLGEIITDLDLQCDSPVPDQCGDCHACLDACPTDALGAPDTPGNPDSLGVRSTLDPRRCISYLTIEARDRLPAELADKMSDRLVGCDTCQDVCPFNQNPQKTNNRDFQPQRQWSSLPLQLWQSAGAEQLRDRFAGNALARANWDNLIADRLPLRPRHTSRLDRQT